MRYESKVGTITQFGENGSNRKYPHENGDYEYIKYVAISTFWVVLG